MLGEGNMFAKEKSYGFAYGCLYMQKKRHFRRGWVDFFIESENQMGSRV
jgi:hypothetical protein